ncbi:MAG TPA: 23S rRNA (uracil(747)-C(5))-methyltransferase RlmC [Ornithinibacter sp.]|nr:23S rRNA (uracil(747)-C(5))-methyltransferase RlmC [Ornithinibacter sp.]HPV91291.1 23S rRNA (uracil(747)-C(5))-methyltransferase RlmC [Ornithinibacter sp.]
MQCDHFDAGRCRSCTLMGVPYDQQLADKERRVAEVLAPVAPALLWVDPARSPSSHYRNKAKLVVGGTAGNPTLGILDHRGRGIDLRDCGLYEPGLAATFGPLHDLVVRLGLEPYDVPARRGELKYLLVTHSPAGEQLVRFVLRSQRHLDAVRAAIPALLDELPSVRVVTANLHPEHKAVLEGDTEIALTPQTTLPMTVGDVTLRLGPRSFFQTNTTVAAALYRQARDWVDAAAPTVVRDLYCGVGGFALHAAAPGRTVVGVETSADAVAAARDAVAAAPDAGYVEFVVGDATTTTVEPAPDLVVVNPPRRGIGPDLAAWLDASPAGHVIYSSCNVVTLARDLAAMPSLRAVTGRVFDMFPQTPHTEVMVLLQRTATPS